MTTVESRPNIFVAAWNKLEERYPISSDDPFNSAAPLTVYTFNFWKKIGVITKNETPYPLRLERLSDEVSMPRTEKVLRGAGIVGESIIRHTLPMMATMPITAIDFVTSIPVRYGFCLAEMYKERRGRK